MNVRFCGSEDIQNRVSRHIQTKKPESTIRIDLAVLNVVDKDFNRPKLGGSQVRNLGCERISGSKVTFLNIQNGFLILKIAPAIPIVRAKATLKH